MSETLTITTPDGAFSAYVARPQASNAPAIVVIQEIFGVNKVMRDICDGLAAQGFVAICPDLFWRIEPGIDITDQSEAEWKRAFELFNAFDVETLAYRTSPRRSPRSARCRGQRQGRRGRLLPGRPAGLPDRDPHGRDASVSYYGVGIEKHVGEAEKLAKPLLMHIAEKDQFVPPEAQQLILNALKDHPQIEIHTYAGRDHAFAREGGAHYDATDAAKANGRSLTFFQKVLA
jgi:carboxymethylenebutenolidase